MTSNISWMNIALKLHLPDLAKSSPDKSITEHITTLLIRNASTRMRTEPEVIVTGLAEIPRIKTIPLPPLSPAVKSSPIDGDTFDRIPNELEEENAVFTKCKQKANAISNKYIHSPIRQENNNELKKHRHNHNHIMMTNTKIKPSQENWIPEKIRFRSIHRELSTIESNLKSTIIMETELKRELRQFQLTNLEKAQIEESLGLQKKVPCACCLQLYSYVNLPMQIPVKAIIDIRKKWSDGKSGWWSKEDERLSVVPRCYEGVKICLFCSQFFDIQEEYRPSFNTLQNEIRLKQHNEKKRLEKEYWDPLKMIEKDREKEENEIIAGNVSPIMRTVNITSDSLTTFNGVTSIHLE